MSTSNLTVIAERYALALISIAEEQNLFDEFKNNLSSINNVLIENKEMELFLSHPTIPVEAKKEIIDQIFKSHVSQYILSLLKLILDKNRFFLLNSIFNAYVSLLNKKRNISTAQIITAIEIDDEVKNRVREKLSCLFEVNIEIESSVNPEIIAGMIIKVEDKVIDGSIKTKLDNMKKQVI